MGEIECALVELGPEGEPFCRCKVLLPEGGPPLEVTVTGELGAWDDPCEGAEQAVRLALGKPPMDADGNPHRLQDGWNLEVSFDAEGKRGGVVAYDARGRRMGSVPTTLEPS